TLPRNRRLLECEALEDRLVLSSNSDYVHNLYIDILNRLPDSSGSSFWTSQLDQNILSRTAVALDIWESDEHRGIEIDNYYTTFLHRNADSGGFDAWLNVFHQGAGELL